MKKIFCLVLVLLVLCGCSGGKSKEELLSEAIEATSSDIVDDFRSNELNAKDKYKGQAIKFSGVVSEITSSDATIGGFKCKLSNEDLKSLNRGQYVQAVGVFDKTDSIEETFGPGYKSTTYFCIMKNCYVIGDTFVVSGKLDIAHKTLYLVSGGTYKRDENEWYCCIKANDGKDYYLTESIDKSNWGDGKTVINGKDFKDGDNITVVGKIFQNNLSEHGVNVFDANELSVQEFTIE